LKDRILVWIDYTALNFGIIKFLKGFHDCEVFAIIDVGDKQKNFYINQNLVSFKKIWFFRDHLHKTNEEPDIEYLRGFEKKYRLNLWELAYSEREFTHYNELYKFTQKEILTILEQECRFFEKILTEINPSFLFIRTNDYLEITLLHELSKSMGVTNLMLSPTKLAETRCMISSNYDQVDDFLENLENNPESSSPSIAEFREYQKQSAKTFLKGFDNFQKNKPQVNILKKPFRTFQVITNIDEKNYKEFYSNYYKTKFKFSLLRLSGLTFTKKWLRKKFLDKNSIKEIEKRIPFVYFPLHVEPERNLLLSAPFFSNQIELASNIAKSLPIDFTLLVKEHPLMKFKRWREISYYKKIIELPNVELVHPDVSSEIIFKNCSLVITISGSSAIQAAFYEKPSIVFSDTIYSHLPFIERIKEIENLPDLIKKMVNQKFDFSVLNEFVDFMNNNTFDLDLFKLMADAKNSFYFGGSLKNIPEISASEMEKFLSVNQDKFEILALEHLKKIKQWKIKNADISN